MKSILLALSLAIAQFASGQILDDILNGVHNPNPDQELTQPLLLSMAPQSGIPYEVLVILIADFAPDSSYTQGMNAKLSHDQSMATSTSPLRIVREKEAFICFNKDPNSE